MEEGRCPDFFMGCSLNETFFISNRTSAEVWGIKNVEQESFLLEQDGILFYNIEDYLRMEEPMPNLDYKLFFERNLPHFQPPGAVLFVTYRLRGSIPKIIIDELIAKKEATERALQSISDVAERERREYLEQRRLFGLWDKSLDAADYGPQWLKIPEVANVVGESLHFLDHKKIDLDTYCIMSNHVHAIFTPLIDDVAEDYYSISSIMHSHKLFTARKGNLILDREGQFWQHESYDHVVRNDQEMERIRRYVLNNPVTAGLVESWDDWSWTYCKWMSR